MEMLAYDATDAVLQASCSVRRADAARVMTLQHPQLVHKLNVKA